MKKVSLIIKGMIKEDRYKNQNGQCPHAIQVRKVNEQLYTCALTTKVV